MNNHLYNSKFGREIMNTAYSAIGLAPANSKEHFYLASHLGFNALKGDVRITKDDRLIMCHDSGITVDDEGYIVKFDKDNYIKFIDYDYDYFKKYSFRDFCQQLGYNAKLCDFETYVRICKENGKIVYITLRNDKTEIVVKEVLRILKKYHMTEYCVINSFSYDTISEVRKYSDTITISQVIDLRLIPDKEIVDKLYALGNSIITLFYFDLPESYDLWEDSKEILEYINEKGIPVHMAQVNRYKDYSYLIQNGVQGFHLKKAFFPYQRADIQFTVCVNGQNTEFGNILDGNRLCADVIRNGNITEIRNIRKDGSNYNFDDGLPVLWLNTLPYKAEISCNNNPDCTICFQNNALIIDTKGIDGTYYININI